MSKLTPEACRAARALLNWGVRDLAREAGVGFQTVARFETGRAEMRQTTADKIVERLALAGVEITNGDGTGARLVAKRGAG
ncbi:MAG: XRE family transcriptional regulator [Alphaproteobacteria bacterium]|nr:XRE family transcriptional regulator [Alphaproteobacteria bacterium]